MTLIKVTICYSDYFMSKKDNIIANENDKQDKADKVSGLEVKIKELEISNKSLEDQLKSAISQRDKLEEELKSKNGYIEELTTKNAELKKEKIKTISGEKEGNIYVIRQASDGEFFFFKDNKRYQSTECLGVAIRMTDKDFQEPKNKFFRERATKIAKGII